MFILKIFIFIMCIGAFVSIFIFAVDVIKWHDKEEKVNITPSAQEPEPDLNEKEVEVNASNDGEYNSSVVSFPWSEP